MTVPLLLNEDGDPVGFIHDVAGRVVERPDFELRPDPFNTKVDPKGLQPGDQVWVEGEMLYMVPLQNPIVGSASSHPLLRFDGNLVDAINNSDWGSINGEPKDPAHWVWPGFGEG